MRLILITCVIAVMLASPAMAQTTVIARARAAAADGRRAEGLALLEAHLAASPEDVDARLVYGLILSWEGRYDDARRELKSVLAQSPDYLDARVALMNVEFWSGQLDAAQELMTAILSTDAGNPQARLIRQRLAAHMRPWSVGAQLTSDLFSAGRKAWLETSLSVGRETPAGSVIVRGNQAERFGLRDRQVELELYPRFRAGTYAFIGVGYSADRILFPQHRLSLDLYQALGGGFEGSVGYRRLQFSERADIYAATLSKYAGNWILTGKVYHLPGGELAQSWSYHGQVRRYFGAQGASFVAAAYSHGLSREEARVSGDFGVNAEMVRGQAEMYVTQRLLVSLIAGTSRQRRGVLGPVWQTTLGSGLTVRF